MGAENVEVEDDDSVDDQLAELDAECKKRKRDRNMAKIQDR